MKKVLVRIGGKDYALPMERREIGKLIMVTAHPDREESVLVWRLGKSEKGGMMTARVGVLHGGSVREEPSSAVAYYRFIGGAKRGKTAEVTHFLVSDSLRRKTVGSAMRELLLREMRDRNVERVWFPFHKEKEFYEKRGFRATDLSKTGRIGWLRSGAYKELFGVPLTEALEKISLMRYGASTRALGVKPGGIKLKVLWKGGKRSAK